MDTTETADSTAQLEFPQETAEVEENVVNETSSSEEGSDNMSLSELTNQLLAKGEEQKEGGEDGAEDTASSEATDQQEGNSKVEQSGLVAQTDEGESDKKALLDQFGIDLDAMDEDQAMSLGRALRTESLKRFGRLTAQKREAEAALKELQDKGGGDSEADRTGDKDGDLIWTMDSLEKKEGDLQAIEDWVEDALQFETKYDENGEEYLVKQGDTLYTERDLTAILRNARKTLRKNGALDQRKQFL